MDQLVVRPIRIEGEARFQRWRLGFTNLTADFKLQGVCVRRRGVSQKRPTMFDDETSPLECVSAR